MIQVCPVMWGVEEMNANKLGLPAAFCVWLTSLESEFLRGRFLFSNWDVAELKAREQEIKDNNLLALGLNGWPPKE